MSEHMDRIIIRGLEKDKQELEQVQQTIANGEYPSVVFRALDHYETHLTKRVEAAENSLEHVRAKQIG